MTSAQNASHHAHFTRSLRLHHLWLILPRAPGICRGKMNIDGSECREFRQFACCSFRVAKIFPSFEFRFSHSPPILIRKINSTNSDVVLWNNECYVKMSPPRSCSCGCCAVGEMEIFIVLNARESTINGWRKMCQLNTPLNLECRWQPHICSCTDGTFIDVMM